MLESLLDEVPGLGETRRLSLLEHFGSIAELRKSNLEQVAAVPGIGEKTASAIFEALAIENSSYQIDTSTGEIKREGP